MYITPHIYQLIEMALSEDLSSGDATTDAIFTEEQLTKGRLLAKSPLVLCGQEIFDAVMLCVDERIDVEWLFKDGESVEAGTIVAELEGPVAGILRAERTGLNFIQRLSAIATKTRAYADQLENTSTKIVDTRKTLPGWRVLDKMAVRCGGGKNHRFNLGGGVMIKDNHIAAAGSITKAIAKIRAQIPHTLKIEVEVTHMDELIEAVHAGADIILLDNMTTEEMAACVARARERAGARPILLEASGGITIERLPEIAKTGVDLISSGALTHSVTAADISLDLDPVADLGA